MTLASELKYKTEVANMTKLISIRRMALVMLAVAVLVLSGLFVFSLGVGMLIFAGCHLLLSTSFFNPVVAEFFVGRHLTSEQKTQLIKVGSSPLIRMLLIVLNCTYIAFAIYLLFT